MENNGMTSNTRIQDMSKQTHLHRCIEATTIYEVRHSRTDTFMAPSHVRNS